MVAVVKMTGAKGPCNWIFILTCIITTGLQDTVAAGTRDCIYEGFSRKDHAGTIHSPGYPLAYPKNTCHHWAIEGTKGSVITIHFQDLDIDAGAGGVCNGDYLEIGPLPEVKICGNHAPPYISQRDHVWIKFVSDRYRSAKGFELHYVMGVPSKVCLSREFRCLTGQCILNSWRCDGQKHCADNSDEENCPADITFSPRTTTTLSSMGCEGTQINCISAYTNALICLDKEKICNGVADCLHKEDEMSPVCDGRCSYQLNDLAGTFHTPNYPKFYPNNQDCSWAIHIPIGTVQLHIMDFKLEDDRGTDFLEIYDGKNEVNTNIIGRYYGRHAPPKVINGRTNWMIVRFHSNSWYGERGFNATYQKKGMCLSDQSPCGFGEDDCYHHSERCDGSWDCKLHGGDESKCGSCKFDSGPYPCGKDFSRCYKETERCTGLVHCFNNADEMGCTSDQCGPHNGTFLCHNSRCIYDNWRCDQTDDCGDSSDEYNCPASRRVIIAAVIGSLICALLLVVALGCTCKLYALRLHEHYGSHHETPMSRVQDEINRRPAPPTYHEAMATSQPYDQSSRSVQHPRRSRGRHGSRSGRPPRPPPPRGPARPNIRQSQSETVGENTSVNDRSGESPNVANIAAVGGAVTDSVNSTHPESSLVSYSSSTCLIPPSTTSESEVESEPDRDTTHINMCDAAAITVQYRRSDESRHKSDNNSSKSVFQNVPSDVNTQPSSSTAQADSASADTVSVSCDTDSALLSLEEASDKSDQSNPSSCIPIISTSQPLSNLNRRNSGESLNSEGSDVPLIL